MLTVNTTPVYASLNRQVNHWSQAASRLSALDHLASGNAWHGIEQNLGKLLRQTLQISIQQVVDFAKQLHRQLELAKDNATSLRNIKRGLIQLREQYLKAEETIHFYTIAINSRTTPNIAALLRACDILCIKSMQQLLFFFVVVMQIKIQQVVEAKSMSTGNKTIHGNFFLQRT